MWANRNPQWEKRHEDSIIKNFCDYGRGATSLREDRGEVFGAGYEIFIVAFFIGLYFNRKRPLIEDTQKRKTLGQPIQYWGNIEQRETRKSYPKFREYIFTALVARTDIDFIALDKGELSLRKAVDILIQTMEEYANYGFHFIKEKGEDIPNFFYKEDAFLSVFLTFDATVPESTDDTPEPLD